MDVIPQAVHERVLAHDFAIDNDVLRYLIARGYFLPQQFDEDQLACRDMQELSSHKPPMFLYYLMTTMDSNFECS
jgi:hypothetical protein